MVLVGWVSLKLSLHPDCVQCGAAGEEVCVSVCVVVCLRERYSMIRAYPPIPTVKARSLQSRPDTIGISRSV